MWAWNSFWWGVAAGVSGLFFAFTTVTMILAVRIYLKDKKGGQNGKAKDTEEAVLTQRHRP